MDRISTELQTCFSKVFPNLRPEEIQTASVSTVKEWDSLASATLLSLITETFEVDPEIEDYEQFTSFEGIRQYLETHVSAEKT